jgi:hypothetical protein
MLRGVFNSRKSVDAERANKVDDIRSFLHNVLVHDLVLLVGPRLERLMRRDHTAKVPSTYIGQGRDSKPSESGVKPHAGRSFRFPPGGPSVSGLQQQRSQRVRNIIIIIIAMRPASGPAAGAAARPA